MTYNVFGGTFSLTQSISLCSQLFKQSGHLGLAVFISVCSIVSVLCFWCNQFIHVKCWHWIPPRAWTVFCETLSNSSFKILCLATCNKSQVDRNVCDSNAYSGTKFALVMVTVYVAIILFLIWIHCSFMLTSLKVVKYVIIVHSVWHFSLACLSQCFFVRVSFWLCLLLLVFIDLFVWMK